MDPVTRLKLKSLTRAVYDSGSHDPREPKTLMRFLPSAGTVLALVGVLVVITWLTLWNTDTSARGKHAGEVGASEHSNEGDAQSDGQSQVLAGVPSRGNAESVTSARVVVHVVGQVSAPGVYELSESARVLDAVEAAGGATAEAQLHNINLARPLVDGEQIVIPGPGETQTSGAAGQVQNPQAAASCIDLNTATVAQLQELDGVGPALAGRIAAYREENGRITSVDQLDAVSGIGASILEKIRPGVCQ